ncbi:hypothetical protein G4H71_21985 [Rhodococcus triatomae]|uniref:Lipoprotein n=1 Tax=Rhodococcus triatomae TaxID=300028 RepID=A0A1G8P9N1_9NOCA|nr:hypothetical protein [Rhodococcus triatomae]QNG18729.1 hypothetical protein G4H72_08395 [Rhodococcus triatomae]QNG25361.1 hypothetical protein G4H71_21985 [Rhodococcus triatomae]SDI88460.1 hypothetical protein SAMN05444695_11290 [Rhodococcus triatomae]
MTGSRSRVVVAAVAGASILGALVTGCSSNDHDEDVSSLAPATVPQSPPAASTPAGSLYIVGRMIDSTTFDPVTRSVVVVTDERRTVLLLPTDDLDAPAREITLDDAVASASDAGDGTMLLAMNGQVARLDVATGRVDAVPVDGQVLAAAQLSDGRVAAGLDNGEIHILDQESDSPQGEAERITGLSGVDGLAVAGDTLTALDRSQTSVTAVTVADGSLGLALRAGDGASALTSDHFDRVLVTDTLGDELLVYSTDELMLRQRFPTGGQPYAVAYDDSADRVWVTLPTTNEVVGYDLSTGVGVETARFPTVRQPNSLAVDADGDLLIGSATGDGLQRIPTGRS